MDTAAGHVSVADLDVAVRPGRPPTLVAHGVPDAESGRAWLTEHRPAVRAALDRHGCLFIRGIPLGDTSDFAAVRDILVQERASYREKATPRSDYGADVFSSTDLPAVQPIRPHNENSYTLEFPGVLLFGCLVAPDEGGATTVADSREVLAALPDAVVARFRAEGWTLRRNYQAHLGLPWATAFGTDSREEVEQYCRQNLIGYRWLPGNGLLTSQRRPAIVRHPGTGEEVWFNHVAFWNEFSLDAAVRDVLVSSYGPDGLPFQTRYGDGEPIPADVVGVLNEAYDAALRRESWQPGDLLLVDNVLCSHGREPFTGNRQIVVAMGEPTSLDRCRPTVAAAPGVLDG
jgi:alpha-ketoglutarate-dependent taurine dioxygenase